MSADSINNKISSIIDQYDIEPDKAKILLTYSAELAQYLMMSKDELLGLSKKEVQNRKFKFKKIIEGFEYLKSNVNFAEFLRFSKEDVDRKLTGINTYNSKLKETRAGKIKPFYRELNQVFNYLRFQVEMPLKVQIDYVHALCVAFEYEDFGKKHLELEHHDSTDLNAFKREEKDIIEKWQKDSEFDFSSMNY